MRKLYFVLSMLLCSLAMYSQNRQLTGTVRDNKSGEALIGATVVEEGTTNGGVTDVNGSYTVTVGPDAKVLVVSYLGMTTKKIPITDKTRIDVNLNPEGIALDEVVVTALGVSKEKKSLGYNVSEVSGEDLNRSGEANVIEGLAAKASGIQVVSSGGTPGASSRITIRGGSTFTGENQPLIVVDGVPMDNQTFTSSAGDNPFNANLTGVSNSNRALDLNPDDIESVSILKGPAAAALYGARAANGAIVYTTKKGKFKRGQGIGVTLATSVELQQVNKLPEIQRKYAQGRTIGGVPTYIGSADPGPDELFDTADDIALGTNQSWGPTISSLGLPSYNNAKNFFKTGVTYNTNLAIEGGNEQTTYRFSYSNYNNTGVVPETWMKRNSARLSADHKINEKLQVGTSISYMNTRTRKPQNGSNLAGVMLGLLRMPSTYDVRDYIYPSTGYVKTYYNPYDNPLYTVNKNPFTDDVNRVFGNTYIKYDPLSWLNVTYKLGLDNYSDQRQQVYAVSSIGDDNNMRYGQLNLNGVFYNQIYSDLLVTAKRTFDSTWNTSLTLGNNIWLQSFKEDFMRGRNLSIPDFYNLNNASDLYTSNSGENKRTYAYFFDGSIDYKSKIFLNLSGRNEWASTFEQGKNSFFYPAASLSFVITEIWKLPKWFSFGKVRAAYAESGVSPQPYRTRTYYEQPILSDGFTNGISFPYLGYTGYGLSNSLGDPNLKPERLKGQEYGADLRFFNGRLTADVTYYIQKTVDILIKRPVAPGSGFIEQYTNSGQLQNKGWEISLGATAIEKPNFTWDINVTWYKNNSKVLKLVDGVDALQLEEGFTSIGAYAIVGQPLGSFYGTKWRRTNDGQLIINPATGLPYIDPSRQNLGSAQPQWLSGIRNTFTYKKISFTFLWDIRKGGKIWDGTLQRLHALGISKESEDRDHTYVIDGVLGTTDANGNIIATNTRNNVPVTALNYFQNYKGDTGGAVEEAIEDGSWVRLRDIGISYRLDMKKYTKYIRYIDISVSSRNLLLFTKYKGVDPETSLTGAGSNIQGFDYFNNPNTRSYFFGLKFGF